MKAGNRSSVSSDSGRYSVNDGLVAGGESKSSGQPQQQGGRSSSPPVTRRLGSMDRDAGRPLLGSDGSAHKPADDDEAAQATATATVFNIVNNIVGVGVLTLPWAVRIASITGAFSLMASGFGLSMFAFVGLALACEAENVHSYQQLARILLPGWLASFIDVTTFFFPYSANLGYAITVGDYATTLAKSADAPELFTQRWFPVVVVGLGVMLPLSAMKYLHKLQHVSTAAVFCVIYAAGVTLYEWTQAGTSPTVSVAHFNSDFFTALGVMMNVFACHYNAPQFYREMENRSVKKFSMVAFVSFAIVLVLNTIISLFAYLQFGEKTEQNLLESYGDGPHLLLARVALTMLVTFSYPILFASARRSLMSLVNQAADACCSAVRFRFDDDVDSHRYGMTLFLVLVSIVVGVSTDRLGNVIAVAGALFGSVCVFIFPGYAFYRSVLVRQRDTAVPWKWNLQMAGVIGLWVVGGLAFTVGSYTSATAD